MGAGFRKKNNNDSSKDNGGLSAFLEKAVIEAAGGPSEGSGESSEGAGAGERSTLANFKAENGAKEVPPLFGEESFKSGESFNGNVNSWGFEERLNLAMDDDNFEGSGVEHLKGNAAKGNGEGAQISPTPTPSVKAPPLRRSSGEIPQPPFAKSKTAPPLPSEKSQRTPQQGEETLTGNFSHTKGLQMETEKKLNSWEVQQQTSSSGKAKLVLDVEEELEKGGRVTSQQREGQALKNGFTHFVAEPEYEESTPIVEEIVPTHSNRHGGKELDMHDLLEYVVNSGASDLHLTHNAPPIVRIDGDLEPVPGWARLTGEEIQDAVYKILESEQKDRFDEEKELDFAYTISNGARFRGNLLRQMGHVGAVFRVIPQKILPLSALNLPAIIASFAYLPRGLVLVTGPTGSGKSTTLAAIIDLINRTRQEHILTIEDPIEFVHRHRSCVVNQREVGRDTAQYHIALKHALRQDPDVILIGEMRDLETISIALTAAETGHLIFATLHTQSAKDTVSRIIDVFPAAQQQQVRSQLAATLRGVVCQTLVKRADGKGRIAATEIMIVNHAIANNIRQDKLHTIPSSLQTGEAEGNQTLNMHLTDLILQNTITKDEALKKTEDASELETLLVGGRSSKKTLRNLNEDDEDILKHIKFD